jgi:hypothetical protein
MFSQIFAYLFKKQTQLLSFDYRTIFCISSCYNTEFTDQLKYFHNSTLLMGLKHPRRVGLLNF